PAEAQARNEELMERYNAGQLTAEQSAEFMLGLLTRASLPELARWHEEFMAEIIRPAIRDNAIELVQEHLTRGDLCAIVTATNDFVTAPIARAFGIPDLIATIAELENGRYTGRIQGVPSFQAGKIVRVDDWLKSLDLSRDAFDEVYFYSDSPNDLPLLEVVSHPIATNPSPRLREIAEEKGWKILDLFQELQDAKS